MYKISSCRLREIRNIADYTSYRAARFPIGRLAVIVEKKYLKSTAHIRFVIDPHLRHDESYHYIQVLENAKYGVVKEDASTLYLATVFFNGDLLTKEHWLETARALIKELVKIMFFSPACLREAVVSDLSKFIDQATDYILHEYPFSFHNVSRPRLTLAMLKEIVEQYLDPKSRLLIDQIQPLLLPYLGPEGW